MLRRWLIRLLFILPILLCVVGWGWSLGHWGQVGYVGGHHCLRGMTQWGTLGFSWEHYDHDAGRPEWFGYGRPNTPAHLLPPHDLPYLGFAAFYRALDEDGPGSCTYWHYAQVPYWFFMFFFNVLLFLVWRKTSQKKPGQGFPVVLATTPTARDVNHLAVALGATRSAASSHRVAPPPRSAP